MVDIVSNLVGSVIGGVIASSISIIAWEWYRKPKLAIEIPDKIPGREPGIQRLNRISRAFYHLKVVNNGKTPAYNCRITMRFKAVSTERQLFEVSGKWDRGPQPLLYAPDPIRRQPNGNPVLVEIPHDFLIPFAEVLDIHPKTSEPFCILIKYENEAECYGFSAWSYIKGNGHKVSDWKLDRGEYTVEVELAYSGKTLPPKKFLLTNYSENADGACIGGYGC